MCQNFCHILVAKSSLTEAVQAIVVGSVVVAGALTRCTSLQSLYDKKAAKMNAQHSLIPELTCYEFKLGHDVTEAIKKIFVVWKMKAHLITQYSNQMIEKI